MEAATAQLSCSQTNCNQTSLDNDTSNTETSSNETSSSEIRNNETSNNEKSINEISNNETSDNQLADNQLTITLASNHVDGPHPLSTCEYRIPPRPKVRHGYLVTEYLNNLNETRKFRVYGSRYCSIELGRLLPFRPIRWRLDSSGRPIIPLINNSTKVYAALVQSRGKKNSEHPCGGCAGGGGPFVDCVLAARQDGRPFGGGACGNCFWDGVAALCSPPSPVMRRVLNNTTQAVSSNAAQGVSNNNTTQEISPSNKQHDTQATTMVQSRTLSLNNPAVLFQTYVSLIPFNDPQAIRNGIKQLDNTREQMDKARAALESRLADLEKEASGWKRYLR